MKWNTNVFWVSATPMLMLLFVAALALASPLAMPHAFAPGTVADANQVNANFAAVSAAVNDNDTRIAAMETNGRTLAAVYVVTWSNATVTVSRSFTNLPGAPAITVTRTGVGTYVVNFGTDIQGRFYTATMGSPYNFSVAGPPFPVSIPDGSITASNAFNNTSAVDVNTTNAAGANTDASFCLIIN